MEDKQREQKRAKTQRSDYLADVDTLQAWMREAELKVQDRSCEPAKMMENIRQIQSELAPMSDKLERLTKNGKSIMENTKDDKEKELINGTVTSLTEQLAQVRVWLEEKKQLVGDTLDAWQRFLALLEAVKVWTAEKKTFLAEPLKLSSLNQARQRLNEYSTAVKSCKQVNKNLSDMGRELESIGQVTSVGDLPQRLTQAEETKVEVEGQLLERNALLQETSEEWEQCERKMKDVKGWLEKARQSLESPQNKKKPLRDQHAIREKMLSDVTIQKTKIQMSVEKLQVHFRAGIGGDNRVVESADELITELDAHNDIVKEQTVSLEVCLAQLDQYQQEIQQLRQQIVQVEQQLRTVLSPTYLPNDREKALQEQQEKMKHDLDDLQLVLAQLEAALRTIPRENLQTMISALSTILADLRYYNQEAIRIENEIKLVPEDAETKKLQMSVFEIRKNLVHLLSEAEQGQSTLEQAREEQEKRKQEIRTYKQCLDETEAWIRHVNLAIVDQTSTPNYMVLREEISFRLQRLVELESMAEVSELAINLKKALQDLERLLIHKQQQTVNENEPLAQIATTSSVDATLDRASPVQSSRDDSSPSLADVSLQTGQSLIQSIITEQTKPIILSKQTSTDPLPISTACQTSESNIISTSLGSLDNQQIQESIKVLKSTDGKHDVIEIATKNISSLSSQEQARREPQAGNTEDIVVDMKYLDAQKQENVTSELNIQHAAPQSFETVLVEPDDVTTEVVVDSDGTKRIIVRKLRRTLVTSRQTTQQHLSQLSTSVGDNPPVVQAFSEATMRGQQVTVTRTKPDGSVEMAIKQSYGGKVTSGTPGEQLNVEEYESTPQFTQRVIHGGDIKDLSLNPPDVDKALVEGTDYHTKTSTVHAVVQQVTRKVIRKTRRIIRKVTIIDGKEVTSEEVVEEPEEVEIDEQGIPHISINVVKSEDQGFFETKDQQEPETAKADVVTEPTQTEVISQLSEPQTTQIPITVEAYKVNDLGQQASVSRPSEKPVEGEKPQVADEPIKKSNHKDKQKSKKLRRKKSKKSSSASEDSFESDKTFTVEEKPQVPSDKKTAIETSLPASSKDFESGLDIVSEKDKTVLKEKHPPVEVTTPSTSSAAEESQKLIDFEKCAYLQAPHDESVDSTTKDVSSLESTAIEDIPTITKASCKFEETPVGISFETHGTDLELGTVEVESHTDVTNRRTVDVDESPSVVTDVLQKEGGLKVKDTDNLISDAVKLEGVEILEANTEILQFEEDRKLSEPGTKIEEILVKSHQNVIPQVTKPSDQVEKIQKIDITLSIKDQEADGNKGPLVSVESHIEGPQDRLLHVAEEKVNITLPAQTENVKIIEGKTVEDKILEIDSEKLVQSPDISETDAPISRKSRKKKKHREKIKDRELSDEESSSSALTTTLAESVEIDIPHSDSSRHTTEKPEPDVYDMTESSDTQSPPQQEVFEGDGYEADQRTTVEETPHNIGSTSGKRKKKKKKKQKDRVFKEEDVEVSQEASEDVDFTDGIEEAKNDESKSIKKSSKKRKNKKGDVQTENDEAVVDSSDVVMNEADTQTTIETRDVSVGEIVPEISQELASSSETMSELKQISKLESEIQTLKVDESHTEIQTSPRPGLDTGLQICLDVKPEIEDSFTHPKTPDILLTEEIALQTTPREENQPIPIPPVPSCEADTQTIIQLENLEVQTSPTDSNLVTEEMQVQTSYEFLTNVEQQTTPPPSSDKTSEEIAIQTEICEEPIIKDKIEQSSKATSPDIPNVENIDVQTCLIEDVLRQSIETQTTPKAGSPVLETQEVEIQTTLVAPVENLVQTSPLQISESLNLRESIEEPKVLLEGESQTSTPEHVATSELSIQTKPEEIVPTVEECIQIVPDTLEISSQTTAINIIDEEGNVKEPETKLPTAISLHADPTQTIEINIPKEKEEETFERVEAPIVEEPFSIKDISNTGVRKDGAQTAVVSDPASLQQMPDISIVVTEADDEPSEDFQVEELPIDKEKSKVNEELQKQPSKVKAVELVSAKRTSEPEIVVSSPDISSTPESSFEIQIEATVEVCGSTTPDSTSQDTTITEEPSEEESSRSRRQKRKRQRNKTVEIREHIQAEEQPSFTSVFGQRIETPDQDISFEISYSDATKTKIQPSEPKTEPSADQSEQIKSISQQSYPKDTPSTQQLASEIQSSKLPQNSILKKTEATKLMHENAKSTQKPSHLSNLLHISTLNVAPEKSFEAKSSDVQKDLSALRNAAEERNIIVIEETFITVIETISTWLETIESRIFLGRECPSGPTPDDKRNFVELRDEVNHVEENIKELNKIWNAMGDTLPEQEREKLKQCVKALESQAKAIEEVAKDGENHVTLEMARWNEFLNGVNDISQLVDAQRTQLSALINSETPTVKKLEELDRLENINRNHTLETTKLFAEAKSLLQEYPGKEVPQQLIATQDKIGSTEHEICVEREKLLELLELADDYEQTLHEFAKITKVAENLINSPVSVTSLQHLQDEMQKHRKFFVNLNHCRAILESLEDNLDPESKEKYLDLHEQLHNKAISLLDQAASKAQQMSLAASRWVVLEQGIKEEKGWLQVAHQRVPDIQNVTSTEYEQYISLYQNLSLDIAKHHGRLLQLLELARNVQNLVNIEDPDNRYIEAFAAIVKLQENVDLSLRRLLAFRDSWTNQEMLVNRLENWMTRAERELVTVSDPTGGHMRQFWELKAQYEVHNNMRNEADHCFEQALRIVPLSDEILQRQFHEQMQKRWNNVTDKIKRIQDSVRSTISSEDVPVNEKLNILERELHELRLTIDEFHGVMKTEEELELYAERLSVLFERVCIIQDELGRLGLLPAAESERVGILLSMARRLESMIGEELDAAQVVRERLKTLKRGIARIQKSHQRQALVLDQCEGSERQGSDIVAAAVEQCQTVGDELSRLWQEIMGLRQLLHTLPTSMRVSMSPVGVERDISKLQDTHEVLESRCVRLLGLLKARLNLWRRFETQLEKVQQSVQETDYMMELLTVQGSVDYERLLKATERLEGLNGEFVAREVLISELKSAAEPLRESCAAEVSERVDAVVNEAVQAWEDTRTELGALCTKYQHAVRLWQQYRDSSAAVKAWVDTQMGSVANLPPDEALKQVKVCEDTLAEHKERLAELRGLVAQIASDVGLDVSAPLQTEVEALGRRLEDARETLSCLADTADARALSQELARNDLNQTKNFLESVNESITTVGQGESKEQLIILRNHLLALTRTEPQLQSIKERALEISPVREPSIVEVLQLWQRVFRETFQQYHRLSARLVHSQDVAAALRLWQEYLGHVKEFLSSSVPGDYNGLAEHRNLCEVHKNLLTDQKNLIQMVRNEEGRDISVNEQFNALTNLHNESLSRIMERHDAVRDRLSAWEQYRMDQNQLLTWLKNVDSERSKLKLRFIRVRKVDEILQKIEALIDRLPNGDSQADALQRQQESLLADCDEALAVSVRMEHAASVQRLSNIRASLETWKDFVTRIKGLNDRHREQIDKITRVFQEINRVIADVSKSSPGSLAETRRQLDSLQQQKSKLIGCVSDLEALGVTTEQLRECLSPSDMKSLNQQCFLFWQQHGDLEHQLALLSYKLGERCSLHSRWESRSARLLIWIKDTEDRIHNCDTANLEEPEEALKRLECEVQAEMALKTRELEWVQNNGLELISIAEPKEKAKLEKTLDEVNERWNQLLTAGKARANKIVDLMQTMTTLQKRLADIRVWLGTVESQLSESYTIESSSQTTIDKKLRDHEQLQKNIETESGNVGEVLNLCEMLLNDCDAWKASFNTDAIKTSMEGLERRWKATCVKSSERKRKIMLTGKLLVELETTRIEYEEWLIRIEHEIEILERSMHDLSKDNTEKTMTQAQKILDDIKAHDPALQILEQCYSRLAKGGLEPENLRSLTSPTRQLIDRWHGLTPKLNTITTALEKDQKTYREFISAHGAAVIGLTQVDVMLTQAQHLASPETKAEPRRRLQQLADVEAELNKQSATLRRADELALKVMRESHSDDVTKIQELVDEYQLLWKNIWERLDILRQSVESQERRSEVDEAVQVETLKFERDTAVQVDTLPKLTRMTSFDAYLIELESAISECRVALDALEDAVVPEPTPGTGLSTAARAIAKLIGSCQSTIELVKHLHNLLSEEENLAKATEVAELAARYEDLLKRARAREQQIRELNDGGRLTCPLCSHRNWAQLDNDLWRLEKWLEFAEGTQSEQYSPPSNIEQLEDIIQEHHEFLLDLDSHKSIVVSLNIVGAHLADHTEDVERANELRDRLASANVRWDRVCQAAANWQNQLQAALMGNQQFHKIIEELLSWLEKTEQSIRASEPIDLTEGPRILRAKYDKFKELQGDLERCEPRVLSLQEAANHLLEENSETRSKLQELRLRLQSLRRLTSMYVLKLGAALGLDPRDVGLAATSTSLAVLSQDLLDDAASGTTQAHGTHTANADDGDQTVLARGYHFIGRVLRASLPIQALMLLLLGAASLVPSAEEDYSCMLSNNLARTFTPLVQYPNGPPPL